MPVDADDGWRSAGRALSWLVAATFLLAAVIYLLIAFNLVVPPPEPNPRLNFVESMTASFEHQSRVWPLEIPGTVLFGAGFFALAGLGLVLGRLLGGQAAASLGAAGFGVAGVLAGATQLVFLGAALVATNPELCDCVYAPEQVVSQATGLWIILGAQNWMLAGSFLLLAAGMALFAAAPVEAAGLSRGWARLSQGLAAYLVLTAAVSVLQTAVDLGPIPQLIVLVGAGILLPIWTIWLARQLSARPVDEVSPAAS